MKHLKFWMASALAFAVVVSVATTAPAADKANGQEKAAVVNNTVITRVELENELAQFQRRIASQGRQIPPDMQGKIANNILDKLIDRELLFQESQKKGMTVTPAAVESQLEKIRANYPDSVKFKDVLKQMNTSEDDVRKLIIKGMAIRELIEKEVNPGVNVSEGETRKFYDAHPDYFKQPERVRASHILIKHGADDAAKAASRKKIEAVRKRLAEGEDFATVAKEVSEGPSAPKGGDLGFFGRGQMVKPFEMAAFALAPNTVSDVVTTRFGLHLIKVVEKEPEKVVAYEEAKTQIMANLTNQKRQLAVEDYLDKLREAASIEKHL